MCESTDREARPRNILSGNRRRKLWELKSHFHCAILGTCLSMDELRKVMRQSGMQLPSQASDYDLHVAMVSEAEQKSRAGRYLQKMLDRKYKRWVQLLARCRESAELEQHWRSAMQAGDIAGAFWAILTHPFSGSELVRQAFQQVHMLSHLQGAANRGDIKRLQLLQTEVAGLRETLSKSRQNHNEQITRRDQFIRQQEHELQALLLRTPEIELQQTGPTLDCPDKQQLQLAKNVERLERQLAERDVQLANLCEQRDGLKELLQEAREEHTAMEQAMALLLAKHDNADAGQSDEIDLRGKRILYVGGRSRMTPHMRSLVEAHNGQFDHHDGGLEDSRAGLQCTLASADMVFCPIDCISHDACRRVKQHCRRQAKQFVPLRSSGLSAFAAGLRQFSAVSGNQPKHEQMVSQ